MTNSEHTTAQHRRATDVAINGRSFFSTVSVGDWLKIAAFIATVIVAGSEMHVQIEELKSEVVQNRIEAQAAFKALAEQNDAQNVIITRLQVEQAREAALVEQLVRHDDEHRGAH